MESASSSKRQNGGSHAHHHDSDEEEDIQKDCPICMTIMVNPCRLQECGHLFCLKCIRLLEKAKEDATLANQKYKCPICRTVVKIEDTKKGLYLIDSEYQKKL